MRRQVAIDQIARLVRGLLFSEPLPAEFAAAFAGMSLAGMDELTKSFFAGTLREAGCTGTGTPDSLYDVGNGNAGIVSWSFQVTLCGMAMGCAQEVRNESRCRPISAVSGWAKPSVKRTALSIKYTTRPHCATRRSM